MSMKIIRLAAIIAGALMATEEAEASRILIPQHQKGSIVIVDDRLVKPNQVIGNLPGIHALASNGGTTAVAAIKILHKTGGGVDFKLAIIDIAAARITGLVNVAGDVGHAAISRDGRYAALTHPDRQLVSLVNLQKGKTIAAIECPGSPGHVLFSRDGQRLFVSDLDAGQLTIISTVKPKNIQTVDGLGAYGFLIQSGAISMPPTVVMARLA
jgi:DNA-binding beta-propeller fold protein YncE